MSRWFNISWAGLQSQLKTGQGGSSIKKQDGWRDLHNVDGRMFAHFMKLLDIHGGQHRIWGRD